MMIQDLDRPVDEMRMTVSDFEIYIRRIYDAIHSGMVMDVINAQHYIYRFGVTKYNYMNIVSEKWRNNCARRNQGNRCTR